MEQVKTDIIEGQRKVMEHFMDLMLGMDCTFWACEGAFHKNGTLIHKTISMVTCSKCNAISATNNLYKKLTGSFYTNHNTTQTK